MLQYIYEQKTYYVFSIIFSALGLYVPVWFGKSMLGGWRVLGGFIGGLFGVWLGAWVSKRYGD